MTDGNLYSKYLRNDTFPILIHFLSYNIHNFHSFWCLQWRGKWSTITCCSKLHNSEIKKCSLDRNMLNLATKKKQPLHDFIILQHNFHDYQWSMAKKISTVPHLKLKMTDLAVLELRKKKSLPVRFSWNLKKTLRKMPSNSQETSMKNTGNWFSKYFHCYTLECLWLVGGLVCLFWLAVFCLKAHC